MNNKKITIFYVIGAGHSGSTLLDMLMGAHSKIMGTGELEKISSIEAQEKWKLCACGNKKFEVCPFWDSVIKGLPEFFGMKIYRKKLAFLMNSKNYLKCSKKEKNKKLEIADYCHNNQLLYQSILFCSRAVLGLDKKIIFDSSKDADRAEALITCNKFNIVLVHLVRDGRGVMYSYKKKRGGILSPTLRWLFLNIKAEIVKLRNKNVSHIFVLYENLVNNPKKELTKLLKLAGLEFESPMLNYRGAVQHQIAGNFLRKSDRADITEDLLWKSKLGRKDLLIFKILAGFLNYFYQRKKIKPESFIKKFQRRRRRLRNWEKQRQKLLNKYRALQVAPDFKKKYIFVALNYQPERNLNPMGDVFDNQLLVIDMISKAAPSDWIVYVKEHPNQMRYDKRGKPRTHQGRFNGYYEEILKYKNVFLVPMETNSMALIDNALAVANVNGSVGWEAILRGRAVLAFGNPLYKLCSGVFKINEFADCKHVFEKIKSGFKVDQKQVIRFFVALDRASVKAHFDGYRLKKPMDEEASTGNMSSAIMNALKSGI